MSLPTLKRKQTGFTLIELLIVVAIIAILISIGLASYSRVQKSSRDSQRKSDLKNIAGALEQYYSDENEYPGNPHNLVPTYLKEITHDPLDETSDVYDNYIVDDPTNPQAYCLIVDLETVDPADADDECSVNSTDYDYVASSQD